jgi:hypothetical protein
MNKVITMIVMLGLTGGAYAAEDAIKALTAQAPGSADLSIPVVAPAEAVPAEVSPLRQEYAKREALFMKGTPVPVGNLEKGGNMFGVHHADLISLGKNGDLKHGDAYLSVFGQDSGRFANADPVYGISAKLNSDFAYGADYVPYNYLMLKTLKMNVSPRNTGTAGMAVAEVNRNGVKLLIARFTEKYVSHKGELEYISYGLLSPKK